MGATGSHQSFSPLPSRQRLAALSGAIHKRFEKRKGLSKTLKRIIHYGHRHANRDQCKCYRELLSTWSTVALSRLVEIYESTITLHQVVMEAAEARCPITTLSTDLLSLYNSGFGADVSLSFLGVAYPAHRAILSARSSYMRKLFSQCPHSRSYAVELSNPVVDGKVFTALLQFIYSDACPDSAIISAPDFEVICQQFGLSRSYKQTIHQLQDNSDTHDVRLVFTRAPPPASPHLEAEQLSEHTCYSGILASRSGFLRQLIERRSKSRTCGQLLEIVLDDAVISYRYAPVLLKLIHEDQLDIGVLITHSGSSASSLSEAQAMVLGRNGWKTPIEEVIELYHVGLFMELPALVQKSEDYLAQCICVENLSSLLAWSSEPSGSRWLYRKLLQFIEENFIQISQSPCLYSLEAATLSRVLQSDFLQASEFDILQAIINWSEHQLIKRMESREPNLVSHTTHSLARKGIRSKDLDELELRDIASQLTPFIRQRHLLASNAEVLNSAIRRGLVISPSSHKDITASEPLLNHAGVGGAWVLSGMGGSVGGSRMPNKAHAKFEIPRAYMPFYDVARGMLEERTHDMSESEVTHLRRPSRPHYALTTQCCSNHVTHSTVQNMSSYREDVLRLVLEPGTTELFVHKTKDLLQSHVVAQALQACWDTFAVLKQVYLWAVRELGYPDQAIYKLMADAQQSPHNIRLHQVNAMYLLSSLVPDLAPERLLLQHSLHEDSTMHSLGSSPDVTMLPVRPHRESEEASCFPDVTLHSHSSSESEGACCSKIVSYGAPSSSSSSPPCNQHTLPEIMRQHMMLSESPPPDVLEAPHFRGNMTFDSRPSRRHESCTVLITNPYFTPPRVASRTTAQDSGYEAYSFAPSSRDPREDISYMADSSQRYFGTAQSNGFTRIECGISNRLQPPDLGLESSEGRGTASYLLGNSVYSSSLVRLDESLRYNMDMASSGPPPDIAPQPPRRFTGSETPPDITSSPNNTWQAMF